MKTVFELKSLAIERGLHGYSRLTQRELVQLLQRDLPSDWVRYDEYADSEFLVHFSYVNKNISKLIFIIKRSRRCFKFSLLSC